MTTTETETRPGKTIQLNVTKVTVLTGDGSDKLVMTFELPSGVYPYSGASHATMECAIDTGLRYVCTHMRGVETVVINTGHHRPGRAKHPMAVDYKFLVDWAQNAIIGDESAAVLPLPEPGPAPKVAA